MQLLKRQKMTPISSSDIDARFSKELDENNGNKDKEVGDAEAEIRGSS